MVLFPSVIFVFVGCQLVSIRVFENPVVGRQFFHKLVGYLV